jgi:hypothetical protein
MLKKQPGRALARRMAAIWTVGGRRKLRPAGIFSVLARLLRGKQGVLTSDLELVRVL